MNSPIADRVAALSSEQRIRLLRKMVETSQSLASVLSVVPPRRDTGPAPLSPAQEDLWMFDALYPGVPAITLCGAYHFRQPVDPADLEAALLMVIERHDILRAAVVGEPGALVLQTCGPDRFRLENRDLRGRPAALDEVVAEFSGHTYDLAGESLIRGMHVEHDGGSVLLLGLHHIVTDWWSFDVVHRDFTTAYHSVRGLGAPPERPVVRYADYAAWQRELEVSGVYARQLDFWRALLADLPDPPRLGSEAVRPAAGPADGTGMRAEQVEFDFDPGTDEAVRAFARAHGATSFHVVITAFAVLANRLSGEPDLILGTPVAHRGARGLDRLVGYVMNVVATRWRFEPGLSFADQVHAFVEAFAEVSANADVPLARVVEAVNPERMPGRSPLIRWMFLFLPEQESSSDLPGAADFQRVSTHFNEYDVALTVSRDSDGLHGSVEFQRDLFDPRLVRGWMDCFRVLLTELLAEDGRRPVTAVPMLSAQARSELSSLGVAPQSEIGPLVPDAIAAVAATRPDAPAVETEGGAVGYGRLVADADRLATALRSRGIGRGSVVGFCLADAVRIPVVALGVLRAGAACLSLDPANPTERFRFMAADSGAALVLVESEAAARRLGADGYAVAVLDEVMAQAVKSHGEADTGRPAVLAAEDLAYVIYTSDSTGKPKGVAVHHGALRNLCVNQISGCGLAPGDRVLLSASFGFGASVEELFPTLAAGGCLVAASEPARYEITDLIAFVAERQVSVLHLPTSQWHEMVAALSGGGTGLPACMRIVAIGGEAASDAAVVTWRRLGGSVRLLNTYGLAETAGIALSHELGQDDNAPPPAGQPVGGVRVYVLDGRLAPVPAGVAGEVFIGGVGVAQGYVGRAGLTAERFIPDPFSDIPGARMYRTGKVGQWSADGEVEFLGRVDRAALPAPHLGLPRTAREPRDETEAKLRDLFAEVLDVPQVGVDDDFFLLGGTSLLITRLVVLIRSVLGAEIEIRELFETRTVAKLAPRLRTPRRPRPVLTARSR